MVRNLNDFREKELIFIDANIFLCHALNTNDDAIRFLQKVETSSFKAATSSLVLEEVFFKLLMQSASNYVEKVSVERVKTLLRDAAKREVILQPVAEYGKYIHILRDVGLKVLDFAAADILAAVEGARRHQLMVADASHLAVMQRKKIRHLASGDRDFAVVPEISVWSPMPAAKPSLLT